MAGQTSPEFVNQTKILPSVDECSESQSRHYRTRRLLGRCAGALLMTAAAAGGMVAASAVAGVAQPISGKISFYDDFLNDITARSSPDIRPSGILLSEDGSVVLENLRWSGWGTSAARATGIRSASSCTPNCATGKRATSRVVLTLSSPERVFGHVVYRCYKGTFILPWENHDAHECLQRQGSVYTYAPVSAR